MRIDQCASVADMRVFASSVDDPALKRAWNNIERQGDYFAQHSYSWFQAWARGLGCRYRPYIICVADVTGAIVGIAAFCIQRAFGMRVLQAAPVRFGDFFEVLISPSAEAPDVLEALLDHLQSFREWDIVRFDNVSESSPIYQHLTTRANYIQRQSTACLIANFQAASWTEYLGLLHNKHRRDVLRRRKVLEKSATVKVNCIRAGHEFRDAIPTIRRIYEERWADDYWPARPQAYYNCLADALEEPLSKGVARVYLIEINGDPAAYEIGFLNRGYYYDWQIAHRPKYQELSIGVLTISYITEQLVAEGCTGINFMAGVYDYKLKWAPTPEFDRLYSLFAARSGAIPQLYVRYLSKWRDSLQQSYKNMLDRPLTRPISRTILRLRAALGH